VLGALTIHVLIALYLTFSNAHYIGYWGPFRTYQLFLHTGPFFSEDAIKSTTELKVSYYKDGEWRDLSVIQDHLRNYKDRPWRLHELLIRDYIRQNANGIYATEQKLGSPQLKKLNNYLFAEYDIAGADSVRCLYTLNEYDLQKGESQPYTLFYLEYRPSDIK
jgi:hypothetical protein